MVKSLDPDACEAVLKTNYSGNFVYLQDKGQLVYQVTYLYDEENKSIICYSDQLQSIAIINEQKAISLGISQSTWEGIYDYVMVHGTFEELQGSDAIDALYHLKKGVTKIIQDREGMDRQFLSDISNTMKTEPIPIVLQLQITNFSGKRFTRY